MVAHHRLKIPSSGTNGLVLVMMPSTLPCLAVRHSRSRPPHLGVHLQSGVRLQVVVGRARTVLGRGDRVEVLEIGAFG